jgi:tetratricopeptide (TPR) repeat protein
MNSKTYTLKPYLMKKLLLFPLFLISMFVHAQGDYQVALTQALQQMETSKTTEEAQASINKFSRIADAEPKQWLPAYYAAYAQISLTFRLKDDDQRDALLDKAQMYIDRALKLQPKESELYVLQGYLHQARLVVSPMMRGMKYSGLATSALEKARQLNPNNPRVYFLLGQNIFNMPSMFGGGPEAAKPLLITAKEKYAAQKNDHPLQPSWGEQNAQALLAKCN